MKVKTPMLLKARHGLALALFLGVPTAYAQTADSAVPDDVIQQNFEKARAQFRNKNVYSVSPREELNHTSADIIAPPALLRESASDRAAQRAVDEALEQRRYEEERLASVPNPSRSALYERIDVDLIPEEARAFHETEEVLYKPLKDIRIAVNMENSSLRAVMDSIIGQASKQTGPWQVKWRVKSENRYLLEEKVNLTAEANFDMFVGYLVDRVNNMSGVQLFVKVFDVSRVIVISDTYY